MCFELIVNLGHHPKAMGREDFLVKNFVSLVGNGH